MSNKEKIFRISIIFIAVLCSYSHGQTISVHQEQAKLFRAKSQLQTVIPQNEVIPKAKSAKSTSMIFGYLPDWGYPYTKSYLRYDILTHIAVFDFQIDSIGTIVNPLNWPWTDVISLSHQNDVKVILCATNFSAASIHALMTKAAYKQNFFANLKTIILANNLDGVNIDFEGLNTEDQGSALNTFMSDLSIYLKAIKPAAEISFAGPGITSTYYDLTGLANACDYIFIMAYSYYGGWSTTTGACAPLTGGYYNVTNTVNEQYGVITSAQPQKLILGLPYYGLQWNTSTNLEHGAVRKFITYTVYADDIVNAKTAGIKWCADQQASWYVTNADTGYTQTWFDSDTSLGLKFALAKSKNFGGVGIWALGYDRDKVELWNKLYQMFYQSNVVDDGQKISDKSFILYQNYPNPFNPNTSLSFRLSNTAPVSLIVYDMLGREVSILVNGIYSAGLHTVNFNGETFGSGIYTAVLKSEDSKNTIKMILLK